MVQKSGQPLSPCVEINGQMLADVSGSEVEAWMVEQWRRRVSHRLSNTPTIKKKISDRMHAAVGVFFIPLVLGAQYSTQLQAHRLADIGLLMVERTIACASALSSARQATPSS